MEPQPSKGYGDGRASPATSPTPIAVPDLPTPTRPQGWLPRETAAGRPVWVSVAGTGPRRGACGSHLRCHRPSAPALHPRAAPRPPGCGGGCSPGGGEPRSRRVPGGSAKEAPRLRASAAGSGSQDLTVRRVRGSLSSRESRRSGAAASDACEWGGGGVPRGELGSRSPGSEAGSSRPLCHPDNYSTMQHPLHLFPFFFSPGCSVPPSFGTQTPSPALAHDELQ